MFYISLTEYSLAIVMHQAKVSPGAELAGLILGLQELEIPDFEKLKRSAGLQPALPGFGQHKHKETKPSEPLPLEDNKPEPLEIDETHTQPLDTKDQPTLEDTNPLATENLPAPENPPEPLDEKEADNDKKEADNGKEKQSDDAKNDEQKEREDGKSNDEEKGPTDDTQDVTGVTGGDENGEQQVEMADDLMMLEVPLPMSLKSMPESEKLLPSGGR
eukprot:s473_g31.t1